MYGNQKQEKLTFSSSCHLLFQARERDASAYEKRIGMEMSESLRKLIEPHFLRRTKAMVLGNNETKTDGVDGTGGSPENSVRYNLHFTLQDYSSFNTRYPFNCTVQKLNLDSTTADNTIAESNCFS